MPEPPERRCQVLFNIVCVMAAGANILWSVLPQAMFLLPNLQFSSPPSSNSSNTTPVYPLSDLVHRPFSEERRLQLLEDTRKMFYFGYDNYMTHAFPFDELNPVNCTGRGHDWKDPGNVNVNDALGDYSLTLVDVLDTLAVMGNASEFVRAVQLVVDNVSFGGPCTTVQVFEATIRVLGSLLSAHLLITDPDKPFGDLSPAGYEGELLSLASDLGTRLLPAFQNTGTGIPHPRVNLCGGVPEGEPLEACTAGAGTLTLEFSLLSRLLGDPGYENAARRAVRALWDRRHKKTGLVGNVIDIETGHWKGRMSGLGAGLDSYYEYLLKSYILFGEREDMEMFYEMYNSIMKYLRRGRKCQDVFGAVNPGSLSPVFINVDYASGNLLNYWMDSLSSSFAAVQVLAGDIEEAICTHALYYSIWRRYEALPERFDWSKKSPNVRFYPLRPELVESTYFLYQATQNPFYLHVGGHILESLNKHAKARCGYSTLHDVLTKAQEDRMESFFLSETCKYLYLLFDTDNIVNKNSLQYLFTTEGHLIKLDPALRKKANEFEFSAKLNQNGFARGEAESAVAKTNQTFVSHSCFHHPSVRKYHLPLSRERLGEIESFLGLHQN